MNHISSTLNRILQKSGIIETNLVCDIHGIKLFRIAKTDRMICSECNMTAKNLIERQASGQQRLKNYLAHAGLGERYLNVELPNKTDSQILNYVQKFKWIRNPENDGIGAGANLIFTGGVGTGKTYTMAAIMRKLAIQRFSVKYVTFQELISSIRHTWNGDSESENTVYKRYELVDFLIIDEVKGSSARDNVNTSSENERSIIGRIIDKRTREFRPTGIVSNFLPSDILRILGQRTYDRIFGFGSIHIIFNGASKR